MYACMQAGSCTFLLFFFRMYAHILIRLILWMSTNVPFVRYFILNFTSHTHHTWSMPNNQSYPFVRFFIFFILDIKSRSSLYIHFSIIHIYSVQLSTKHKSYIHTHIYIYIDLFEARKRKLKNCNYTIGT